MAVDVKEAATRKIGPLPVWAWAGVVGGAVLLTRVLRGGGSGGGSTVESGTPQIVGGGASGGGGVGTDYPGSTAALEASLDQVTSELEALQSSDSANTSLIAELQTLQETLKTQIAQQKTQIAGLSTSLSNATSLNTLQTKLTNLISQLTTAQLAKQRAELDLARDKARYNDGIISKATYDANVKKYQPIIDQQTSIINNLNAQIKTTQDSIKKIGA